MREPRAPGPGEIRIKVVAAGVCGTDMQIWHWAPRMARRMTLPRVLGHEVGGVVESVGPGVTAPKVVSLPEPRYPPAAQRLNRSAQVDIKVLVDERGRVLDSELLGAKAGFGFDEAALDAARRAIFQPATKEGVRVKMWRTLRVNFKPPVR